ncbi:MAG TPA: PAS domain S-box protein [Gemmatimonadales bacterium]|nr:PAS domain S-box protein [Gemmatimonadales bacterium]
MARSRPGYPVTLLLLLLAYVATGLASLGLAPLGRAVSSVWLPSGLAVGALLLLGLRAWPAIFAGAWILAVVGGQAPGTLALMPALGDTLEPLLGWWLLTRAQPSGFRLRRVRDVLWLFAVAGATPVVAATIGTMAFASGGQFPPGTAPEAGIIWWLGNMVGIVAATPLLLVWGRPAEVPRRLASLPAGVVLAGIAISSAAALLGIVRDLGYLFLLAPPVVLATLRWRMRGAATAVVLATIAVMAVGVIQPGVLDRPTGFENFFLIQLLLTVVAGVALLLAASLEGLDEAADQLRDTGEAYRTLLDASPLPIVGRDLEGRITLWNGAAARLFGFSGAEVVGTVGTIVPPEEEETFRDVLAELRRGRTVSLAEVRRRTRAGEIVEMSMAVAPVRGADGAVTGGVVVFNDLTTEKRALAALGKSEERFVLAARASKDAIYDWDIRADHIWWSDSFTELFGHVPASLGPCADSWERMLHPGDRARVDASLWAAVRGTGDAWSAEYRFRRSDGSWAVVYDRGYIQRDAQGAGIRMVGALSDITAQREAEGQVRASEERLRTLVENVLDVICEVGPDGLVRYASPSVRTVLGYQPSQFLGRSAMELIHREDLEGASRSLRRTFQEAGVVQEAEFRVRRADGEWATLQASAKATTAADGTPIAVITARDISGRRELEERLRQATRLEAVGVLAGGVAHDFNNLLTSVLGHAELILAEVRADDPVRPDVEEIRRAANRAAELTRQLLAFSRRQVVAPRVVDLNGVIDGVATMLRRLLGEDITLEFDLAEALVPVYADAAQLEQVIVNLAVNSRDAMPRGGRLSIRTRMRPPPPDPRGLPAALARDGQVVLMVEDTGEGMDPKTLAHAFEPFFTTKPAGRGTGLGLATVYGIVNQAGGHIGVESEPGGGARFTIRLPPADRPFAEEAGAPGAAGPEGNGRETILVVEDETPVRQLATRVLRGAGYHVLAAGSAEEADRVADSHPGPIDLLLTDVVMPVRSGPLLAEGLTARRAGLRVLFMSGYTDGQLQEHGVLLPGVTLLAKPFTPDQLVRRVRAAIDGVASAVA